MYFRMINPCAELVFDSYFMTHGLKKSKNELEIQTRDLKWGWSIIRFWTYRWAWIRTKLILSCDFFPQIIMLYHVIPTAWINMWLNTHLSKYMFFDDSAKFWAKKNFRKFLTKIGTIFPISDNFPTKNQHGTIYQNMDQMGPISMWKWVGAVMYRGW